MLSASRHDLLDGWAGRGKTLTLEGELCLYHNAVPAFYRSKVLFFAYFY